MYNFIFTKNSKKEFEKINVQDRERIINKLIEMKKVENIYDFLKWVYNLEPATHRLRIWNFRILLLVEDKNILILKIWHRKEIYK